jgi:glutamate synthase domain-containing protein 2/glutamate synthase domain-containing protein 1/glutamate synthase domain-containing protein 3
MWRQPALRPALYDHSQVQDSCGVGFLAQISGQPSHAILEKAIEAVVRLTHRGGLNADAATGDGAGILTQIPRRFFRRELAAREVNLGENQRFGVGMIFLPREDAEARQRFNAIAEAVLGEHGLTLLAWRNAPTEWALLGNLARSTLPWIEQVIFAARPEHTVDGFERECHLVRRTVERRAREAGIPNFSICSFSGQTIVHKGLFVAPQMSAFWADLRDPDFETALAIFHQRYSTNTLPNWHLAQPFRRSAHNGEINTLRGNVNWMRAREADIRIPECVDRLDDLLPVLNEEGSDSAILDNAIEFLSLTGRDILHAAMMLVPEAHENDTAISPAAKAFYEYHAALMEPWDGPAALAFTDGRVVGACLDRNGLRPARYKVTDDGLVVLGSEVGLIAMDDAHVVEKGRLGPGRMLAVDTRKGRVYHDEEIMERFTDALPHGDWVSKGLVPGAKLAVEHPEPMQHFRGKALLQRQIAHGWTAEDVKQLLIPMVKNAVEPTGSMGDDTPLPFLSQKPRFLYEHFRQRFAQVTNPAIDPIRERTVMSLETLLGPRLNLAEETEEHVRLVRFPSPFLGRDELAWLRRSKDHPLHVSTVYAFFQVTGGVKSLDKALDRLCSKAEAAIREGTTCLVISNVQFDEWRAPISTLLAVGAVHQHLLRQGLRMRASLVAETGGAKAVHNLACIIAHGANAVCPALAFDQIEELCEEGIFENNDFVDATDRYFQALNKGLLKIMSKMGISTVSSYCGAQIFEAIGIARELIDRCFTGTPSMIGGIGLAEIAALGVALHREAFPEPRTKALVDLGLYRYNRKGEHHGFNPTMRKAVHRAVRGGLYEDYRSYAREVIESPLSQLRDLLEPVASSSPVPIEEVEPAEKIMLRFNTAAMSLGALSPEAHETLAIAMNRIGGRSNSGEGGEDPCRHGTEGNSAIKQVASGRFGVTPGYLLSADQLEIKIAQGAKPGEGGQLPGHKVSEYIANLRHAQPGTTLISPPPHHDIYSIEDLAQLIFDLKHFNPAARVSVKLVAEHGVGTVAAGCAKAGADIVHIAGHEGGTGASPLSSIKHAGSPWEIGLAETQQALVANHLRERVTLRTDGGLKTGRDVIIAACLGADEFGFGTIAVIAEGCVMARQCHMNNCPVGVATQREDLRRKYPGTPDHVVQFFQFVAEDVREWLSRLGARSLDEVIGHPELLRSRIEEVEDPRVHKITLEAVLCDIDPSHTHPRRRTWERNDRQAETVDAEMIERAWPALERGEKVEFEMEVRNTHLTIGARLASEITRRHGEAGLAAGTITAHLRGTAGQSFAAFGVEGMRLDLTGEANDYVGKGLAGGEVVIRPSRDAAFDPAHAVLAGNTILYGATGGALFIAGSAGERFAVRNSGATSVVEGLGDHGCEYMTGGHVVVLGPFGRNFGAGMTGGLAHILAEEEIRDRINPDLVEIGPVTDPGEVERLREVIARHAELTGSAKAENLLETWETSRGLFRRVAPRVVQATARTEAPREQTSSPEAINA